MSDTSKTNELFTRGSSQAVEALTLWADASQRVLLEMAEASTAATREGIRLCAELQQSGLEALREGQARASQWPATWQEAPRDPLAAYQRGLIDTVEHTRRWLRLVESNVQAVTRTAERLQTTAEQASKGMQASLSDAVAKLKDVYAV
jgi:methyl-accepting chemotaxis protein